MPTYRVLYTEDQQENGGWFADVTAEDAAAAAWQQAVQSTVNDPSRPPQLISIQQLSD